MLWTPATSEPARRDGHLTGVAAEGPSLAGGNTAIAILALRIGGLTCEGSCIRCRIHPPAGGCHPPPPARWPRQCATVPAAVRERRDPVGRPIGDALSAAARPPPRRQSRPLLQHALDLQSSYWRALRRPHSHRQRRTIRQGTPRLLAHAASPAGRITTSILSIISSSKAPTRPADSRSRNDARSPALRKLAPGPTMVATRGAWMAS